MKDNLVISQAAEPMKISSRIASLPESETIEAARKSREMRARGIDVIDLSLGEPDFNTPDHIKEGAREAIENNRTHYPPVAGYPELRKAIAEKTSRETGAVYLPEQVVVSTGAKQALANIILCLVEEGDEVILPAPFWVSYLALVKLAGGKGVIVPSSIESNFKPSSSEIEKAITPRTRLFVFSSPCNPTGSVFSKEELHAMARVFERHPQVTVISDEIYQHINYTARHESIASIDSIRERVVIVNGVSKAYAMTGWRLGYMVGEASLAKLCERMQGQITSGASTISQMAALKAIVSGHEPTLKMKEAFLRRRDLLIKLLSEIPGIRCNVPEGAFYVFPEVSRLFGKSDNGNLIEDSAGLCNYLLEKAHVSTVSGKAFGAEGHIRISYSAREETIRAAVERIGEALSHLK